LLDGLVGDVCRGESRSLFVRGEAGIGKTALLEYLISSASDLTVVRAAGVESDMELAYASLHQLCVPLLGRLDRLPAPQRQALEIVFGLSVGVPPDRFLVGLAVLSLFSDVADERPLLCVIDDAQWLDQASALTLAFVARRLLAERVGIVFAARVPSEQLQDLSELVVHGVGNGDARALLSSAVRFRLDERVRERIIAETRGNPLALLELPRGLTATQLAGGFGLLEAQALTGRIEESFVRRLQSLHENARRLLLLAAADLYGEWLRRENRRVDAREQLRTAHEMFAAIGMEAFAERARKELHASGEKVRKRTVETRDDLTGQERQIARLARDGLSNPEIGARLFLSPRNVEWHLRNVFNKLDIRSRRELASALPSSASELSLA
jgi:DNA-binding CsgD family transcriptional regulator